MGFGWVAFGWLGKKNFLKLKVAKKVLFVGMDGRTEEQRGGLAYLKCTPAGRAIILKWSELFYFFVVCYD